MLPDDVPSPAARAAGAPAATRAHAYPPSMRALAAVLHALSRASLPAILVAVLSATDPPVTPPVLVRLVFFFALLPGIAAWLIARALAVDVERRGDDLVLRGRALHVEMPAAAIARVAPWVLPLPAPGVSLHLRSGRRLRYGLAAPDPSPVVELLAAAGVASARDAAAHPTIVYARARRVRGRGRWYHVVGRYPLFALGPTAVLFYTHQHIAYGGLLGEYYLLGLRSWLTTFAVYWATLTIYLVLYASVWRALAETVALAAAHVAPARALAVRRVAETAGQVAYYGSVPVMLALRYLA